MALMDEDVVLEDASEDARRSLDQMLVQDACDDMDYWDSQRSSYEEAAMLRRMDRVSDLIKVESSDDDFEFDWSGIYNDDEEIYITLVKSKSRYGRPSKRALHPADSNCVRLRSRRSDKKWRMLRESPRIRKQGKLQVHEQLHDSNSPLQSVEAALPADIMPAMNSCDRCFTVEFLSGGRVVYSHDSGPIIPLLRRTVRFRAPHHAYTNHPATPSWARRPGR